MLKLDTNEKSKDEKHQKSTTKFTGVAVTFNEAQRLRECLTSLRFCEQLVVIDLGSTDGSLEIAEECGAEIIHQARMPIVEQVRIEAVKYARNEWLIFVDPDEIFPHIQDNLNTLIADSLDLGGVSIPLQYYFMGKKLTTTIWGTEKHKLRVVHKDRVVLDPEIHKMIAVQPNFREAKIEFEGENYMKHYWADSYRDLVSKHLRYIVVEGKTKLSNGEHFSMRRMLKIGYKAFWSNFIEFNGWRGGWHGWFLSLFYAWYVSMCLVSLLKFELADKSRK